MDWGKVITGPAASPARGHPGDQRVPERRLLFGDRSYVDHRPDHLFFRSLDGGKDLHLHGGLDPDDTVGYSTAGAGIGMGTVYVPMGSPAGLALAASKDEATRGPTSSCRGRRSTAAPRTTNFSFSTNVTTDSAGTVYVTWVRRSNSLPYLAFSRDGGRTWSTPVMIGAPGCPSRRSRASPGRRRGTWPWRCDPGHGPANGDGYSTSDGRAYNAYLTVTTNLFADSPVFLSATSTTRGARLHRSRLPGQRVRRYPASPAMSIWTAFLDGPNGMAARRRRRRTIDRRLAGAVTRAHEPGDVTHAPHGAAS